TQAVYWYSKAAEAGVPYSQYNLAVLLVDGKGCVANPNEAIEWYEKAAGQGMLEAMSNLGKIYYLGEHGIKQSYSDAAKWLSQAAEKGDPWAQNTLGFMTEAGLGVKKDPAASVDLYRKAAEQGDAKAQSNLGRSYFRGIGVKRDLGIAYKWLKLS